MKKQICSIKHFKTMLKQFEKKASKQITDKVLFVSERFPESKFLTLNDFLNGSTDFTLKKLRSVLDDLLKNFKSNTFKTKSVMTCKYDGSGSVYRIGVSYTVEDKNGQRLRQGNSDTWPVNKFIVFRVWRKQSKKKILAIWNVPITWI